LRRGFVIGCGDYHEYTNPAKNESKRKALEEFLFEGVKC
jgi:hypothetical protein